MFTRSTLFRLLSPRFSKVASAAALLVCAGIVASATAQQLPDPPVPVQETGPFRIPNLVQFIESYKQAGSPKLLIACEVFGVAGDSSKTLNNQALAARLSSRMQDAFRNAEIFIVSGGASQLRRAENDAALTRIEGFAAAKALSASTDAQVVMYVRLIEQTGRVDGVRYTGSYTVADLRRGQSLGSFAWDVYQDPNSGELDAYRMGQYASVIATRMSYDFVDSFPLGGAVAGMRSFTVQLVGDYADDDLKSFRDALRSLPGAKGDSVRLEREDATTSQKISVFSFFYSGDLIDLRSDLRKAAINELFMEAAITSAGEGTISIRLTPLSLSPKERAVAGGGVTERNRSNRDALAIAYEKAGSPTIAVTINRLSVADEFAENSAPSSGSIPEPARTVTTDPAITPNIIVGNRIDLSKPGSLEDLVAKGITDEFKERRVERREDGQLDVSYFEAKLVERLLQLRLNVVDLSAAQSKVLSSPEALSIRRTEQSLAFELAKAANARVVISGVGKLVRDRASGQPTRVIFTVKAYDTQSQTLLASTSVQRELAGSLLTFNESIDELVAQTTGSLVSAMSDHWSK